MDMLLFQKILVGLFAVFLLGALLLSVITAQPRDVHDEFYDEDLS